MADKNKIPNHPRLSPSLSLLIPNFQCQQYNWRTDWKLIRATDFNSSANVLSIADLKMLPLSALFIPSLHLPSLPPSPSTLWLVLWIHWILKMNWSYGFTKSIHHQQRWGLFAYPHRIYHISCKSHPLLLSNRSWSSSSSSCSFSSVLSFRFFKFKVIFR